MEDELQKILSQSAGFAAGASSGSRGTVAASTATTREMPANPLMEELTKRLLGQGQGVSSSATTNLQNTIAEAMKGVEKAGASTTARLQSERSREIGYAQDRAGAQFTTALESRTGYATQVVGLRELTETTEKSIRDLDQRYQEAIMANDANTAQQLSNLKLQKLQFQAEQEERVFSNLLAAAGMQQQAIGQMMQNEQFWQGQEQQERQFAMTMAQSNYQFQKNLGIQYKQLDLQSQELDLQRERNAISRAEFNLKKAEIEGQKKLTTIEGIIGDRLRAMQDSGQDLSKIDNLTLTTDLYAEIQQFMPDFKVDADKFAEIAVRSKTNVMESYTPPVSTSTFQPGPFLQATGGLWNKGFSPMVQGLKEFYIGKNVQ